MISITSGDVFSRLDPESSQASDGVPAQGRLVCDKGVPLEGLQFTAVGVPPAVPEGVCDKAAGIEK